MFSFIANGLNNIEISSRVLPRKKVLSFFRQTAICSAQIYVAHISVNNFWCFSNICLQAYRKRIVVYYHTISFEKYK